MFSEEVLGITTIDEEITRRREDGFYINPSSDTIYLASIIPDFTKVNLEALERSLKEEDPEKRKVINLFDRNTLGFKDDEIKSSLVVKMEAPYNTATVIIGKAIITTQLTFEIADWISSKDPSLQKIFTYVESELGRTALARDVIYHLSFKFNFACADAMRAHNIPYLSSKDGRISLNRGFPIISKPLRDPSALINCFQLSSYLETGEIPFSKDYLNSLCCDFSCSY